MREAGRQVEGEALEVHLLAVLKNLQEFHGIPLPRACELTSRIKEGGDDWILHVEPYLLAFELVKGAEPLSDEVYRQDRPRALELLAQAKQELAAVRARPAEPLEPVREKVRELEALLAQPAAAGKRRRPAKLAAKPKKAAKRKIGAAR